MERILNYKKIPGLVIFLFCVAGATLAAIISVRIDGEAIKGDYLVFADEIYIPQRNVEDNLKEKIGWNPQTQMAIVRSEETNIRVLNVQGEVYFPLQAIARHLGYRVEFEKETSIIRIATQKQSPMPSPSPSAPLEKKLKITINSEECIGNVLGQITALRIFASVRNGKEVRAKNVEAICKFYLDDGTLHLLDRVSVGNLEPGEKKDVIFYSPNPNTSSKLKYALEVKEE